MRLDGIAASTPCDLSDTLRPRVSVPIELAREKVAAGAMELKPPIQEFYSDDASNMMIPVIDLSPFFHSNPSSINPQLRESVVQQIAKACEEWGFFQVINHGIPLQLMEEALDATRTFFDNTFEEKMKFMADPGRAFGLNPTGYNVSPPGGRDLYEHLYYRSAGASESQGSQTHENEPQYPLRFRSVMEETVKALEKAAALMESVVSQSLGLPAKFLEEYNEDKRNPLKLMCYPTARAPQEIGAWEHQDASYLTLVAQDETGGYQVLKDRKWVDVAPIRDSLVINVGDILQVWSNNRFRSAVHRVVLNNKERRRCSFAFGIIPGPDKLVKPLPHFTTHVDKPAAYRPFWYKDYTVRRIRDKTHPPANAQDFANISTYAIDTISEAEQM